MLYGALRSANHLDQADSYQPKTVALVEHLRYVLCLVPDVDAAGPRVRLSQ